MSKTAHRKNLRVPPTAGKVYRMPNVDRPRTPLWGHVAMATQVESLISTRRKRARAALVLATVLTIFEFLGFANTMGRASDPLSVFLNGTASLAIGFLFCYFVLTVDEKIRGWWRVRHPRPIPSAPGSIESFHWTGRPARVNVRQVMAVFVVFGVMAASVLVLPLSRGGAEPFPPSVLGLLIIALLGFFALGTGLMTRVVTFDVDEQGVRTHGMFRASFTTPWRDVGRIEFFSMEKTQPFAIFAATGRSIPPHRMYALLGPDGHMIGGLLPQGTLGQDLGNRLEAALITQSSRRGIPIVEVRWRDSMRWKRRQVPRGRIHGTT